MAINNNIDSNAKVEEITRLMQLDDSIDAPQDSLKWAKNLYRSRITEPKPSLIRRVTALLQIELSPEKPVFGERSASEAGARQMLFDAGENAVDLRIKKTGKVSGIQGQILGEGFEGAKIILEKGGQVLDAIASQQSSFRVEDIPDGLYTLRITTGETEIVIEEINVA